MAGGKSVLLLVGGLLVGYLAGSYTSSSRLHPLEVELQQTKAALEKEKRQRAPFGLPLGLPSLLRQSSANDDAPPSASEESSAAAVPVASVAPLAEKAPPAHSQEDRRARMRLAAETWDLRRTQARTAFLEKVAPDEEQAQAFEALVDSLNKDIHALVKETLEHLPKEDEPRTRDAVDFGVALGAIYQDADDQLHQMLTESQLPALEETEFDVFSQIDPQSVMPLVEHLEQMRPAASEDSP